MIDSERIDAIEQSKSLVKARAIANESPHGFEEALFSRLREQLGSDTEKAYWISKVGERFDGSREAWGHRFKAVRLRAEMRWVASANSFLRAEEAHDDPVAGAAMAVGAIDSLGRAAHINKAVELGQRFYDLLSENGRDVDAGRAALNTGNALLWGDHVREAIPWLQRAASSLEGAHIEQAGAWLGLSTAQIDFGRAIDVREHAELARSAFESLGLEHYARIAEQNLAQASLMDGRLDDALETLLRLRVAFPTDGEDYARTEQFIGETYLRLNMPVEARQAFRDAMKCKGMRGLRINRAQVWLGTAEAESELGERGAALKAAARARSAFLRAGNRAGAALARSVALNVAPASGQKRREQQLIDLVRELGLSELRRKTVEALLQLAETSSDRKYLDQAVDDVDQYALVDLEWLAHTTDARTSEGEERLAAYREMATSIWQARAVQKSTLSRQYFLQDKDDALREYLALLLEERSPDSVAEALEVVGQSRSISLIDEILGASRPHLDESQVAELERLRIELREAIGGDSGDGSARGGHSVDLDSWQRAWREAEGLSLQQFTAPVESNIDITLIDAGGFYHRIFDGVADRCGAKDELDASLRWLEFDLMEPVINPSATPEKVMDQARVLGQTLLGGTGRTTESVAPDLGLWGVPWPVLADAVGVQSEPVLAVAPAFNNRFSGCTGNETMLIWYQEYADLPHIGREIAQIVEKFPDAQLCCSAEEVRNSLKSGSVDLLHVATHARLNRWNPMFSSLQFHDGAVFASEIARSHLRVRLVTMSACETALISTVNKNEPDGLVRAALALGAESVVASGWSLNDRAAYLFVSDYYQAIKNGKSVTDAVKTGRKSVRKEFKHPYYWGAMVTFGGYLN